MGVLGKLGEGSLKDLEVNTLCTLCVIRVLSIICEGTFCENSWRLAVVHHFAKELYRRCLIGSSLSDWFWISQSTNYFVKLNVRGFSTSIHVTHMRSHDKSKTSPLSQFVWSPGMSGWWYTGRSSLQEICMTCQWGGPVRSCYKLNTLHLHLQKIHGDHTRQGAYLPSEAPTLQATWPFDHMTSVRSRDSLKVFISTFTKFMPLNFAGCWLRGGGLARKCLSRHRITFRILFNTFSFSVALHIVTSQFIWLNCRNWAEIH